MISSIFDDTGIGFDPRSSMLDTSAYKIKLLIIRGGGGGAGGSY